MKTKFLTLIAGVLLISCQEQPVRYTQQSPEIETMKSVLEAYKNRDVSAMNAAYADTARIFVNSATTGTAASEENAKSLDGLEIFSESGFDYTDDDIEMVVTDKGETWVNFWGKWTAKFAETGESVEVASHITARFIEGKIVREYDYFDTSSVGEKYDEIQAAAAATDSTSTAGI